MNIQSNLGGYFTQFGAPLSVNVTSKLTKWPNLQTMGHDGMLNDLKSNFHGITDAKIQFALHTAGNPAQLAKSFIAIQSLILLNKETSQLLSSVGSLGPVGASISGISSFGSVFSMSSSTLKTGVNAVSSLLK